jgi:hypothetical protein
MTDGQSARGLHGTLRAIHAPTSRRIAGCDPTHRTSPPRITCRWFVHGAEIIYLIIFLTKFGSLRGYVLYLWVGENHGR